MNYYYYYYYYSNHKIVSKRLVFRNTDVFLLDDITVRPRIKFDITFIVPFGFQKQNQLCASFNTSNTEVSISACFTDQPYPFVVFSARFFGGVSFA